MPVPPGNIWFHGDTAKRHSFTDQQMDRPRGVADPNAQGPGIYWTSDYPQARGYAYPDGYIYTARIEVPKRRLLTREAPMSRRLLTRAIEVAPEESRENGFSNWGETPFVAKRAMLDSIMRSEDLHEAFIVIYHEIYQWDAEVFARAMHQEVGFDAFLHELPQVTHLIVWNPAVIEVVKEEKYVPQD